MWKDFTVCSTPFAEVVMHWMVEVDEKDEARVRLRLSDIGATLADEPPEPLEHGRTLIFCSAGRALVPGMQRIPGVVDVMPDIAYEEDDDPLSGCDDEYEDQDGPLEGCDEPGDPDD